VRQNFTARAVAACLATLLTVPQPGVLAAPSGTIEGAVTLQNRPLRGATLAFVNLTYGSIHRAVSDGSGHFTAQVPPGQYAVTTETGAGLVVDAAPASIVVDGGRSVVADIGLLAVPGAMLQEPPPLEQGPEAAQDPAAQLPPISLPPAPTEPVTATTILHDAIGCMIAGQFPLVNARIEPSAGVARARVYFRSVQSPDWFYVEMGPLEGGGFSGKLPRPKLEASPVTYYIQATTTEFGDAQIAEIQSIVVQDAAECEERAIAPIGGPGEVTVFSAATGAAIAPAGFAAGGIALTAATIALIIGGAAAAGITAAVTVFNPEPTPTPPPVTIPTPPPVEPTPPPPSPSPSPEPEPPPATPFR
jgi:hypothetical protein